MIITASVLLSSFLLTHARSINKRTDSTFADSDQDGEIGIVTFFTGAACDGTATMLPCDGRCTYLSGLQYSLQASNFANDTNTTSIDYFSDNGCVGNLSGIGDYKLDTCYVTNKIDARSISCYSKTVPVRVDLHTPASEPFFSD